MYCYMSGFNTAQICARIHFMLRPEWARSHEINSTLKGHGKMAVIVHYIQVGVVWASYHYKRFYLAYIHELISSE